MGLVLSARSLPLLPTSGVLHDSECHAVAAFSLLDLTTTALS